MTRIFHSADAHGSNVVWKKYLNAASVYKVNVILLCGDLTGKAFVPVIKLQENEWFIHPYGKAEKFNSKDKLEQRLSALTNQGYYVFETTREEVADLQKNREKVEKLFAELMKERMDEWLRIVEEKVPRDVKVIVMPGNDDIFEVDEVIKNHEDRTVYPLGKVVDLDDKTPMVSCEYVNPTPWATAREASEEDLLKMLEKEFRRVGKEEYPRLVCNFHAPPYGTLLDEAPKLDKNLNVVNRMDGSPEMIHVGSKSVRMLLERYEPQLGLHGHIHEGAAAQKIGQTLVINPGSDYQSGVLRGYIVDLAADKNIQPTAWRVEG
jgi:Icc-related predicted phosphoesterase